MSPFSKIVFVCNGTLCWYVGIDFHVVARQRVRGLFRWDLPSCIKRVENYVDESVYVFTANSKLSNQQTFH